MAERNPPLWLQNRNDHTAENDRVVLLDVHDSIEGCLGFGDLKVTQRGAGANMSVDIAAGRAAIKGDDNVNQGMYGVWNDATVNRPVATADGTNPRKDIVVARLRDAFYTGALNEWALEVITGVPAATPAEPAVPNNAIKLATIDVPAGLSSVTNANITDQRVAGGAWRRGRGLVDFVQKSDATQQNVPANAVTDLTGVALTINWELGRRYKISFGASHSSSVGSTNFSLRLNIDGAERCRIEGAPRAANGTAVSGEFMWTPTSSASQIIKLQAVFSGAAGTVHYDFNRGAYIHVIDVGGYCG